MLTPERRQFERLPSPPLHCSLGTVVDLSAGGLRLISRRPLCGEHAMTIDRNDGAPVRVRGRVVWFDRVDSSRYLCGMEFVDVLADTARRLMDLTALVSIDAARDSEGMTSPQQRVPEASA